MGGSAKGVVPRGYIGVGTTTFLSLPPSDENAEPRTERSGVSGLRRAAYSAALRARLRKSVAYSATLRAWLGISTFRTLPLTSLRFVRGSGKASLTSLRFVRGSGNPAAYFATLRAWLRMVTLRARLRLLLLMPLTLNP